MFFRPKLLILNDLSRFSAFCLSQTNICILIFQKSELICLTDKVVQYDAVLNDKQNQVDKLISELREANLVGLSLQPSVINEDYHHHHHHFHAEGDNQDNNSQPPFSHRSGSTRRIVGSPRQLENAVATNKNPHGVWV